MIRKVKGGWRVVSHRIGKNLGTYKTKEEAEKRLKQIQFLSIKELPRKEQIMKKILNLLILTILVSSAFVFSAQAQGKSQEARDKAKSAKKLTSDTVLACDQTAVNKRELAIQTAFGTFSFTINNALQTRQSELATAWSNADRQTRKSAIRAAWSKFKKARIDASKTFDQSRKSAWSQFGTDVRTCGSASEASDEQEDSDLKF